MRMQRYILLATAVVWVFASFASALTMTPTQDDRYVGYGLYGQHAEGVFATADQDVPAPAYAPFNSVVSDNAGEMLKAEASQRSVIQPLMIGGTGSAESHADWLDHPHPDDDPAALQYIRAQGESVLDVYFSINQSAIYSLSGLLSVSSESGFSDLLDTELLAQVSLQKVGTSGSVFEGTINEGQLAFDETGVIEAGDYRLYSIASSESSGPGDGPPIQRLSFGVNTVMLHNSSGASHYDTLFQLSPIPEPVTASLSMLALGALALQTSRRRRT